MRPALRSWEEGPSSHAWIRSLGIRHAGLYQRVAAMLAASGSCHRPARPGELPSRVTDSPSRHEWADAARGLCIALVVLLHVSGWVNVGLLDRETGIWLEISEWLRPLRMPLFFLVSGFLASPALGRPLTASRGRTLGVWYLYIFWSLLLTARLWIPDAREQLPGPGDAVQGLVLGSSYWYLYALPIFFLLSRASRGLSQRARWLPLLPLAALSALAPALHGVGGNALGPAMDPPMLDAIAANAVWFYLGSQILDQWLLLMRSARPTKLAVSVLLYITLYTALAWGGLLDFGWLALSGLAIYASSQFLGLARLTSRLARTLSMVGRQTLPVYVLHFFAVAFLSAGTKALGLEIQQGYLAWSLLAPPLLAVAITSTAFVVGRAVLRSRAYWLLAPPRWLTGQTHRAAGEPQGKVMS